MYKIGDKFTDSQRNGVLTVIAIQEDSTLQLQWDSDTEPYIYGVVALDTALELGWVCRFSKLEEALFNLKADLSS